MTGEAELKVVRRALPSRRPVDAGVRMRNRTFPPHADIQLKEEAMEKTKPVAAPAGRCRPGDEMVAFLEALSDYAELPPRQCSI
jgi:hypothetical protein